MARFLKCLCIPALVLGLLAVADAPGADAANGFPGGLGISSGHVHGHHPGMGRTIRRVHRSHGGFGIHFGHRPYFHDTSHFDYHGPQLVPHNGHFHVLPGHWHLHRSGHWH